MDSGAQMQASPAVQLAACPLPTEKSGKEGEQREQALESGLLKIGIVAATEEVAPTVAATDVFMALCCFYTAYVAWAGGVTSSALGALTIGCGCTAGVLRFGISPAAFHQVHDSLTILAGRVGVPLLGLGFARAVPAVAAILPESDTFVFFALILGFGVSLGLPKEGAGKLYTTLLAAISMGSILLSSLPTDYAGIAAAVLFLGGGLAHGDKSPEDCILGGSMRSVNMFHCVLGVSIGLLASTQRLAPSSGAVMAAEEEVLLSVAATDLFMVACCFYTSYVAWVKGVTSSALGAFAIGCGAAAGVLRFGVSPQLFQPVHDSLVSFAGRIGVPLLGLGFARTIPALAAVLPANDAIALFVLTLLGSVSQSWSLYVTVLGAISMVSILLSCLPNDYAGIAGAVLFLAGGLAHSGKSTEDMIFGGFVRSVDMFHVSLGLAIFLFALTKRLAPAQSDGSA